MAKEKTPKVFSIKNAFVNGLAMWLMDLALEGMKSRERTRFVRLLSERSREIETTRRDIINKYGKKDKNGEVVVEDDQVKIEPENMQKFVDEMNDYFGEELVIDVLPSNESQIRTVKDIVLNTNYQFGPRPEDTPEERERKVKQANDYEMWCAAFENTRV